MATVSGRMSALPVSRRSSEAASQGTIHILEQHTWIRRSVAEGERNGLPAGQVTSRVADSCSRTDQLEDTRW